MQQPTKQPIEYDGLFVTRHICRKLQDETACWYDDAMAVFAEGWDHKHVAWLQRQAAARHYAMWRLLSGLIGVEA